MATPARRRQAGGVQLPSGVGAALGRREAPAELSTPFPKRLRETQPDADQAGLAAPSPGTPDTPAKRLQVSLRTSVNEQVLKPPPGEGAARVATTVEVLGDKSLWSSAKRRAYEWMDESLEERSACIDERLAAAEAGVVASVRARHLSAAPAAPAAPAAGGEGGEGGEAAAEVEAGTVGVPSQSEVILCGRIACEGLEGRLNERSLLLEGSRASSGGASVRLNVTECPSVAAFPGQIVGVLGRSGMSGATFHARAFVSGLPVAPRSGPRGSKPLHAVVAAGPFCLRDGIDYAPLETVLDHAAQQKPDVLFLLGPFLDAANLRVLAGDPVLPNEEEPCSFEEVYSLHILPKLTRGIAQLKRVSPETQVLLVPSLEEALCFHPLPQPPLDASLGLDAVALEALKRLGARLLPNPAHVQLGDFRVSVTSADALSPLLRELVLRPEGKKIQVCLGQLLHQQSLFPVLPRDPACVSEARAAALHFPGGVCPDLCLFPSQCGGLSCSFVEDTGFINPGSVCRPAALGSFAEFWVAPSASGAGAAGEAAGTSPLAERVRVDFQRLS